MTELYLSEPALLALQASVWLSCGFLIGALYFMTLHWNIRLFVAGRGAARAMVLQLGRLALLAGALAAIVSRFGALPLLLAASGIVVARVAALRIGEQP